MVRTRIFYPSLAPWVNGVLLHRVQTVGATTTFNSQDLFELGSQDIQDVVDDVPAVAVTLDTNDFGSVDTVATLAGLDLSTMSGTASNGNANLAVVSGTDEVGYLHGVLLFDFATGSCNGETGVDLYLPVQDECSAGTTVDNIDFTRYISRMYVNSVTLTYGVGATAAENYRGETDNALWLLNDARFVTYEKVTLQSGDISNGYIVCAVPGGNVATLSDGNLAFLKQDLDANPCIVLRDSSFAFVAFIPVTAGTSALPNRAAYDAANNRLYFPTVLHAPSAGQIITMTYGADLAGDENQTSATRTVVSKYYEAISPSTTPGGLRQGQVELYIVDPSTTTDWERALRIQNVTISANVTRTQLSELGRLRAYDRPVNLPIPITVNVSVTAADLKQYAIFAGKLAEYDAATLTDLDIFDLLAKKDSVLVVKVFHQTDEEAGGTASSRKVLTSDLLGQPYWVNGTRYTYASTVQSPAEREYALKTIIVPNLIITEEGFSGSVTANATQSFNFRARNTLIWVKGDIDFSYLALDPGIVKNA